MQDSLKSLVNNTSLPYTHFFYNTLYTTNPAPAKKTGQQVASNSNELGVVIPATVLSSDNLKTPILNIRLANLLLGLNEKLKGETDLLNDFIPDFRPIFRNVLTDGYFLKTSNSDRWQTEDRHHLQINYQDQDNYIRLSSQLPSYKATVIINVGSDSSDKLEFFYIRGMR